MQNISSFPRQRIFIVCSVLLFHALALWALQAGLLQRVVLLAEEIVIPVEIITSKTEAPKPKQLVPEPAPKVAQVPKITSAAPSASPAPVAQPAPLPSAIADPTPADNAPSGVQHSAPLPVANTQVSPGVPAPAPKVELPSSMADYLRNPKPKYPRLSQSRNEQGTVILGVLVGVDGRAKEVGVKTSSGYERLDQAAREAVLEWAFVPGKRNGAAVEMWVDVPIRFKPSE